MAAGVLAGDESHSLQALWIDRQVLLQEPAVNGVTQNPGQLLILQAIDREGHAGAEDNGHVYAFLVHIRQAPAGVSLAGSAALDVRGKGALTPGPSPSVRVDRRPSIYIRAVP